MIKKILKKIAPKGTRRFSVIKRIAVVFRLAHPFPYDPEYERWIEHVEPLRWEPTLDKKNQRILFSVVIPFYNTKDKYLRPLIDSLRAQSYQNWEVIVADASTDTKYTEAIKLVCEEDDRLKYTRVENNGGISENTNHALRHAKGEYVIFCDHDDTLDLHAINEVACLLTKDPSLDIIYSDEDKLSDNGLWRHSPFFKPGWSPHMFLNTNYTNHLSVIKKKYVEGVGGLRSEFDGSQDYDLLLRIHRKYDNLKVGHIDKILYHWREADGSTAINHNSKSYAFEAGRKALQEFMDTGPVSSVVTNIKQRPGFYSHKFTPRAIKKATVIVAISQSKDINEKFIDMLKDRTIDKNVTSVFVSYSEDISIEQAIALSNGSDAVFIFRDTALPTEYDWLERLCGVLELPDVQSVAPLILNADMGRVTDAGLVNESEGRTTPLLKGLAANDQTLIGHAEWVRDVDQLSGRVEGFTLNMSHKKKKQKTHNVIWSYVLFKNIRLYSDTTFFNNNIYTSKKGKIRIHGEE